MWEGILPVGKKNSILYDYAVLRGGRLMFDPHNETWTLSQIIASPEQRGETWYLAYVERTHCTRCGKSAGPIT